METLKVGIREFREKLAGYLESNTPLATSPRRSEAGGPNWKRCVQRGMSGKALVVDADILLKPVESLRPESVP